MEQSANQNTQTPVPTLPKQHPSPPSTFDLKKRFRNLWLTNRWLAIAIAAGVSLLALLCAAVIVLAVTQVLQSESQPSDQTGPTPQTPTETTRDPGDNQFFAKQPLTMLYYSFSQTTNSKNIIQATPIDKENRVITIGYPDKYEYLTSPDGKWLLRWDSHTLARANATEPTKFTSIYTATNQKITSVIWQLDSSSIALTASQEIVDQQTGDTTIKSTISFIPFLTLEAVTILEDQAPYRYVLVAFPATTRLYFQLVSDNIPGKLTLYNIQSKKIDHEFPLFDKDDLLSRLSFTSDMKWAYTATDTQLVRYNLETLTPETIYTIDRDCGTYKDNQSTITTFSISPSGQKMLIDEDLDPCNNARRKQSKPHANAQHRLALYSLPDMGFIQAIYDAPITNPEIAYWSPTEAHLWLQIGSSKTFTLNIADFALTPIPPPQRQSVTKERLFFIGWLKP